MEAPWIAIAINAFVLLCGLWVASIRMTLKVATIRGDIERAIRAIEAEAAEKLDGHSTANVEEFNRLRREIGETIAALRQKINDDAMYAAKEYMRRDGFFTVKQEIEDGIRDIADRLEKRLERMETKLDSKT